MFTHCVIITISVALYLHGFFPIPTRSAPQSHHNVNFTEAPAPFKRAVIVVIDALRLDFVSPHTTPFLSKTLLDNGCFIKLKVETPTVTLPRIKALTTGQVPQFIDIIINLASPTKLNDSFIHQAHLQGKKIVFYGDDVWLKLFPSQFLRSEGTTSFYVTDFKEVDDNVTRNVKEELDKVDWNIMILHYLGLDHIGHVLGPKSHLIAPKLKEMDDIVKDMFDTLNNTLFLITADHGMRDSGGHGGSTFPETNVPLVVLGMPCHNDTFAQIDIPAHLAILLGFKIPATSIGQLHPSLFHHQLSLGEYLVALEYNTLFLANKMNTCTDKIEVAKYFHNLYKQGGNDSLALEAADLFRECSRIIGEQLLKSSIEQNMGSLVLSTLALIYVGLKMGQKMYKVATKYGRFEEIVVVITLLLQFPLGTHGMYTVAAILVLFMAIATKFVHCYYIKLPNVTTEMLFFLAMLVLHPLSFLSSSLLEEEHQFWYFFATTFLVIKLMAKFDLNWFYILIVLRYLRTINQVGDKWSSSLDTADWLLQSDNYIFLQLTFVLGLGLTLYCNLFIYCNFITFDGVVLLLIYIYRTLMDQNTVLGQILWLLLLLKLLYYQNFLSVWVLVGCLLLKPYNVIIIPACILASGFFHKKLRTEICVITHWCMGNLLFFVQGHDNSLASVDISSGYVGLSRYDPVLVIPQVLCHTYAFPVLSHLLLFKNQIKAGKYLPLFVLLRTYIIVIAFVVIFVHRHHLFIWSVFAPKIFVEASHLMFLIIEVQCYYVGKFISNFPIKLIKEGFQS